MFNNIFYLFIFLSLINIVHFGLYIVGANFYDIAQFKASARKLARKKRRNSPLVSVIIPAHNEEKSIIRCLESVRKNTHRKLQIIVVNDASTDNTRRIVQEYIEKHANRDIKLMYKQKNVGKAGALNHALRRAVRGEFVMTLDADSVIGKKAIKNALEYFQKPSVVGVAANVRIIDNQSVLGLLQKFEYMIGYRSKKFFSVTNSEFIIGGVGSTYRTASVKKVGLYDHDILTEDIALSLKIVSQGNKANRIVYAYDVLAMTEGVQSFGALLKQRYRWKMGNLQAIIKHRKMALSTKRSYTKALTWYRLPMAFLGEVMLLMEPIVFIYVAYVCFQLTDLSLLAGAYVTITGYLLWNIMPDEHMSLKNKLSMGAYAPAMYFIMYLMNVVQMVAIVRCLINPKKMLRRGDIKGSWLSPERTGQQVQFS